MAKVRSTYVERLAETRAQIARLRALEAELEASIDYLDTCESCDLDVLSTGARLHAHDPGASCNVCQHRESRDEPELVAGIHAGGESGERREPPPAPA
jgi:hypothetical protein